MRLRLTCKEAHRLVSEDLDRSLSVMEQVRLRMHLLACDGCTNFKGQMRLIRHAMHNLAVPDRIDQDGEAK